MNVAAQEPWFRMYLESREPIPINVNPYLAFHDDPDPAKQKQTARAANLLYSSMRFFNALKQGTLEPDMFHLHPSVSDTVWFRKIALLFPPRLSWYWAYSRNVYPLDMSQYGRLFQSTRIPGAKIDTLQSYPDSRHVVVMRRGHFWTLPVLRADGAPVEPHDLRAALETIIADPSPPAAHPLGALTAERRDVWANVRKHLMVRNAEAIHAIDSALFVLCLDDVVPSSQPELSHVMLHGLRDCNRWFDKSFSLIVLGDGKAAVNFEHSWGDGVAVLRYFNEVFADTTKVLPAPGRAASSPPRVEKLTFDLDERGKTAIDEARQRHIAAMDSLKIEVRSHACRRPVHCAPTPGRPGCRSCVEESIVHALLRPNTRSPSRPSSRFGIRRGRARSAPPLTVARIVQMVEDFTFGKDYVKGKK